MSNGALDTKARYGHMPTIRRAGGASEKRSGLTKSMIDVMVKGLGQAFKPYIRRIGELERRFAELESAQTKSLADSYKGTFLAGTKYVRGDLLTHGGSLWMCMKQTSAAPGDGADWKLIVKRGDSAR